MQDMQPYGGTRYKLNEGGKVKAKIKDWGRMVVKLKGNFLPRDYHINIFKQLQNLKQRNITLKEYTEEFYKLNIRVGHVEENDEKVARYITGLRFDIQEEISLLSLKNVEDAYQAALAVEEKISQKQKLRSRRGMIVKDKGLTNRQGVQSPKEEEGSSSSQTLREIDFRGRRSFSRGRGQVRNDQPICFNCRQLGNMSSEFPENISNS